MPPSRRRAVDVAGPSEDVLRDIQDAVRPARSRFAASTRADILDQLAGVVGTPAASPVGLRPRALDLRSGPMLPSVPAPARSPAVLSQPATHPLDVLGRLHPLQSPLISRRRWWLGALALTPWVIGAGIVISGLLYVSQYGLRTKSDVMVQGTAAVAHMLAAKDDAERMDWESAGANLRSARDGFDSASHELDILGPAVTKILSHIPGLGSLRAGQDVLAAGRLLSEAGLAVSDAVGALTNLGDAATAPGAKGISFAQIFPILDDALSDADDKVAKAAGLLASIDEDAVPEDLRDQLAPVRERVPRIRELINQGAQTVAFLGRFMGDDRPRRYLVLFQNSSELRPTGGFPGSYGLLTMQGGKVTDWRADDIYNPDGQIKELIVPPIQLQHITPGWGMRDANWFVDFTVSAPKVVSLWRRGGGTAVDGVIAIRPEVLGLVLKATGAISLDGYDAIITADNFLPILQSQVEIDRPTGTPKRIIADLAPVVLDRLASLPGPQWMKLLDSLRMALERRDALLWFDDADMLAYADSHDWSGRVAATDGDYLMAVISNIKGAKTDAVTATSMKLESRLQDGTLVHRLTLSRRHDGDASPYGFYDKPNRSYVRVLVPKGSTLRGINGNAHPEHRPLVDYAGAPAVRDPDLVALEATYHTDEVRDVTTYEESGKTGFGFWMEVTPGDTGVVQLEYAVPAGAAGSPYQLYVQRQPGLDLASFELTLDKPGLMVSESSPAMVEWPDSWRLHSTLERDLKLEAVLR